MFSIPISVLSEIIGTSEKELRTAYRDKLTGAGNHQPRSNYQCDGLQDDKIVVVHITLPNT